MCENLHNELEKIRLNTGGYFQSEKILYAKWFIFIKDYIVNDGVNLIHDLKELCENYIISSSKALNPMKIRKVYMCLHKILDKSLFFNTFLTNILALSGCTFLNL